MSTATQNTSATATGEMEFVTFHVGNILIGADIRQVEEINRHVEVTAVPHSPGYVRGVINLRGEVVTVVDLRSILGLAPTDIIKHTRTVVVNSRGEHIGLLIDRIADVVKARTDEINPPPANVGGVEGRFFKEVYKLETELLIILDIDAALAGEAGAR